MPRRSFSTQRCLYALTMIFDQERIAEVLEEQGYWKAVTVFQKLDSRRYGLCSVILIFMIN